MNNLLTIKNIRPFVNGELKDTCNIIIADNKILEVSDRLVGTIVDGNNAICCAGYIDIHTHGGGGKDCMEANFDTMDIISNYHLSTGTTTYIPTTMTASIDDITLALDNIRKYKSNSARIFGVHMEGPYLDIKSAGAHPPHLLIAPIGNNANVVWDNADIVSRITIAPNLEGAEEFCRQATALNIQVSLGHDNSIDDEILACVNNGANSVTHLYNCTSRPSRRTTPKKHLGLTEIALMDSRLVAEVIADNRHVPNSLFGLIYNNKGQDGICLVSDSLSVAGIPQGDYYIGSGDSAQVIRVEDGVAVLPALNTYAGSVTPISKMTRNLLEFGIPLSACLKMGTLNPAKLMNMQDRGDLQPNMLADFNLLDDNLNILSTYLNGKKVN